MARTKQSARISTYKTPQKDRKRSSNHQIEEDPSEQLYTLKKYENQVFKIDNTVQSIAVLPNGNVITSSMVDGSNEFKVWDITTGQCMNVWQGQQRGVNCVAVLPNGNVVSGSWDTTLNVWDINTGKCVNTFQGDSFLGQVLCVAALPNGNVISGSLDALRVWDINTGQCVITLRHNDSVNCVAVLPNGNAISGSRDTTLKVWDIHTGQCLNTLNGHGRGVTCVAVLPNGNVVSGSEDTTLKVWDVNTGHCLNTLKGHKGRVQCVAILFNGQVISGSWDQTLKVWDIRTGQCVNSLKSHNKNNDDYDEDSEDDESCPIYCVAVLPNGNIISGSDRGSKNQTLNVWIDNKLQNEYRISRAARILAQGYRDGNCLFSTLRFPRDLGFKIAGLTGDLNIHSEGQAIEIAKRFFCKPKCNEDKKRKRKDSDNEKKEKILLI